ncbi:MAG: arylsulfatase [Flavobacteriaceae bacterium]
MKNLLGIATFLIFAGVHAQEKVEINRTVLPVNPPYLKHIEIQDARDAKAPEHFSVKAPKGAPNVVVIMLDDNGFGSGSTFGGPIQTSAMDHFAEHGLIYNKFHTTSVCSPTRQALLTGRNHHTCNQASISETATSFPGYTGELPSSVTGVGKILKYNGYATAAFGKWHQTATWELNPSGPFDRWPDGQGFDEFYGFLGGETNQWSPNIYHNRNRVELPEDPDYHFMKDMTDQAIGWVKKQQSFTPDVPYFLYFAPGAVHAPHHVPQDYIDRQKGKFDKGWDVIREETLKKQIEMGLVPKGTKLPPKPADIKDWKDLSPQEKKLFARQAEVFAGFLEMADFEIGRLLSNLEDMGKMDNTLVLFLVGDNGTSAEGGMNGMSNEYTYFNMATKLNEVDALMKYYDQWGSPSTYPHMSAGWAVAFDSPFKWTKQIASDYGGTRNGLMIHWPEKIKNQKAQIREQWHHVVDITPTILDAVGIPEPMVVDGIPQIPMAGRSMMYTFNDADAPSRREIQYFEMMGNRGLYYDGWFAGTVHMMPWKKPESSFAEDTWYLYHVDEDFNMTKDLAKKYPEKLEDMKRLFADEAIRYSVYPLEDRREELLNPEIAGRPNIMKGRHEMTLFEGFSDALEGNFLNIKNKSWEIEAELSTIQDTQGVILQQAGRFGGWSFYVQEDQLTFVYNYLGFKSFKTQSSVKMTPGTHKVKMHFDYKGPGYGKGGEVSLYIDDQKVGTGMVPITQAIAFSGDETANVGKDKETMVTEDYTSETSKFNGKIKVVHIRALKK